MLKHSLLQSLVLLVLSLVSVNALADRYPPPTPYAPAVSRPTPDREGLTLGVGFGAGRMEIRQEEIEADNNLGVSLRIGLGLSQSFLLHATLDLTQAAASNDGAMQLVFGGFAATVYLHPRLYLSAGLGYANMRFIDAEGEIVGETEDAAAGLLGVGIEVLQSTHFALGVELRGFATTLGDDDATGANLLISGQIF